MDERNILGMEIVMDLKKIHFSEWYYLLVVIGYIMTLVSGNVRPGIIASTLLLLVAVELLFQKRFQICGTMDILMAAYPTLRSVSHIF